jgi:ligand-binding sensor domain-containing protein/two-component sensor histidine kinase
MLAGTHLKYKFARRILIMLSLLFKLIFYAGIIITTAGYAAPEEYTFKQFGIKDGLSQTSISAIIQDSKGFMWFGTLNGLNKFDGYSFTVYTHQPNDTTSISANGITAIYEDQDGMLWIGTTDGILNKFDRTTEIFYRHEIANRVTVPASKAKEYYEYPISFSRNNSNTITTIAEDNTGKLWLGTWGKGLFRFNKKNGEIRHFYFDNSNPHSLSYNRIMSILVDSEGTIWVGTFGGGLNKVSFSEGIHKHSSVVEEIHFIQYKQNPLNRNSLSDNKVISLFEDRFHSIWIGTYDGGLNQLKESQKNLHPADAVFNSYKHNRRNDKSLGNNTVMAITGDTRGYLWIGTFGGGLNSFDYKTNSFLRFLHDPFNANSITDNDVLSICEDRSGIIWIGTHLGEGISKLERSKLKFGLIQRKPLLTNTLSDKVVWAIYEDEEAMLWIGTYRGGLNRYDRYKNKFTSYKHDSFDRNSLSDDHIRSIKGDKFGNLWLGTYSGGLNRFEKRTGKFTVFKHDPENKFSIAANQILSIHIDKDNIVWLATFGGGLNYFDLKEAINSGQVRFNSFRHNPSDSNSISDDRVYNLFEDNNGTLWIGTFGGGINRFDKKSGKFESLRSDPKISGSLSDNRVLSVYTDSRGILWAGTYGGGLNRYNSETNTFKRYSAQDGLTSDVVYGVLEDENNNLWISTDNGLFKYNFESGHFTNYSLFDGLQSLEFSGGAFFKSTKGELFFGGIDGVNHFFPANVQDNPVIPQIAVTSIKIFNQPIKGEKNRLALPYNQNSFTFEFAALEFTNPANNQYVYILEGYDKDWQYTDASIRMVNYTNLSPGKYYFKVTGSNNDGVWNPVPAVVEIEIFPPLWQRWWFVSLSILLIAGLIYYIGSLRVKNLLAIEKLKTKLAADLHDNIGAGLTEISILSELASSKYSRIPNGSSEDLKNISELARQLVDNMSDIVWVVNPKRDSLYDLIVRLKDTYSEFLSSIGITFKTSNLEKLKGIKLPMDYRQHLYLIFKEAINNSVKHSKCKKIFLDVNLHGDNIELTLTDDGIGILKENSEIGDGLTNIRNRAESIGGKLQWESIPGHGTKIRFVGRIDKVGILKSIFKSRS